MQMLAYLVILAAVVTVVHDLTRRPRAVHRRLPPAPVMGVPGGRIHSLSALLRKAGR